MHPLTSEPPSSHMFNKNCWVGGFIKQGYLRTTVLSCGLTATSELRLLLVHNQNEQGNKQQNQRCNKVRRGNFTFNTDETNWENWTRVHWTKESTTHSRTHKTYTNLHEATTEKIASKRKEITRRHKNYWKRGRRNFDMLHLVYTAPFRSGYEQATIENWKSFIRGMPSHL